VASKLFIRVVFEFGYLFEFGVFARIVRKASSGELVKHWSTICLYEYLNSEFANVSTWNFFLSISP